eukprot:COSAG02_NODE_1679_length_11357_cov_22.538462_4_plen_72_part_00
MGTPEVGCLTERVCVCRHGRSPDVQGCRVRENGGGEQQCAERACAVGSCLRCGDVGATGFGRWWCLRLGGG